jgi:hypothetical protein
MQLELNDKAAALNSIILQQFDHIQQASGFAEFAPLVRAANGQQVPKNHLKAAVIKAIDILISRYSTDLSTKPLQTGKRLLTNEIERNAT